MAESQMRAAWLQGGLGIVAAIIGAIAGGLVTIFLARTGVLPESVTERTTSSATPTPSTSSETPGQAHTRPSPVSIFDLDYKVGQYEVVGANRVGGKLYRKSFSTSSCLGSNVLATLPPGYSRLQVGLGFADRSGPTSQPLDAQISYTKDSDLSDAEFVRLNTYTIPDKNTLSIDEQLPPGVTGVVMEVPTSSSCVTVVWADPIVS